MIMYVEVSIIIRQLFSGKLLKKKKGNKFNIS